MAEHKEIVNEFPLSPSRAPLQRFKNPTSPQPLSTLRGTTAGGLKVKKIEEDTLHKH
jgi:hypothetical protein